MVTYSEREIPVLIVGGGLAGLTTAVALGLRKIPTILIERRPEILQHPRADGFTPRTIEIFRSLGFSEDIIPEVVPGFKVRRARVESLTGKWFEELSWNQPQQNKDKKPEVEFSPCRAASIPQDLLEPVLFNKALELGVEIRLHHKFVSLVQDTSGVTCNVTDTNGKPYLIQAEYIVAADGHRSSVREALKISRRGHGHVNSIKSVLFRAPDLAPYLEKGVTQFTIDQEHLKAFMIAYQDGRLVLHLPHDREVFSDEVLLSLTQQAVGNSEIELEMLGSSRWDMSALIADTFAVGRVFLVGDSAHSLPPNRGGYGANTGIADAHNLAWKITQVLDKVSDPQLLSTYETERLPVAWLRHDQIFARADYKTLQKGAISKDDVVEALDDAAVEFGQIYRSSSILGSNLSFPDAQTPEKWAGQPGTRAPHVMIQNGGRTISTLDLFGRDWVLISEEKSWEDSLEIVRKSIKVDVSMIHCQSTGESRTLSFSEAYGLTSRGCSLVRPDGYIAWRSEDIPEDPMRVLEKAVRAVTFSL